MGGRPALVQLLRHFYADVRQHEVLAPIFAANVEDWPSHLEKIADFWSSATGGPPRYNGPMPAKHFRLGLDETHFDAWLELWRRQCRIHLPAPAGEELIGLAEAIGQRIQLMTRHASRQLL